MKHSKSKKSGFTLIELIVVLTILAFSAILIYALRTAKEPYSGINRLYRKSEKR